MNAFCDAGISRKFAEAVWSPYTSNGVDLHEIAFLEEQRAFVRNLDNERTSEVPIGINDKK